MSIMSQIALLADEMVEGGLSKDFIMKLDFKQVQALYYAWDRKDPDEQWEYIENFCIYNGLDVEEAFEED